MGSRQGKQEEVTTTEEATVETEVAAPAEAAPPPPRYPRYVVGYGRREAAREPVAKEERDVYVVY